MCRKSRGARISSLWSLVFALAATTVEAVEPVAADASSARRIQPALGIYTGFSRWNGKVRLVYDPDDAPPLFADQTRFLDLLKEALGQWERVSGIRFELTGSDRNAPDDVSQRSSTQDGLVRIAWNDLGTAGSRGSARPDYGAYDSRLGYPPYDDGAVRLNSVAGQISSSAMLVGVLVHELGHLLGLGHSDDPDSVMFANPYNQMLKPRPDDIRAVQTLYGPPETGFDPDLSLKDWLYVAPPAASSVDTEFLFKPNSHSLSGTGAYFAVDGGNMVTTIDKTASQNGIVNLRLASGISRATAVSVPIVAVMVDPSGYEHLRRAMTAACPVNGSCVQQLPMQYVDIVQSRPGNWQVNIENAEGTKTLINLKLPVAVAERARNFAPRATLTVAPGPTATTAQFTLTATDPEGDDLEVIWYPPNVELALDRDDDIVSGASVSRTFDFGASGTHTFFVAVNDDNPRYPGSSAGTEAGEGFQTLLRVTVSLAGTQLESVHITSTGEAGLTTTSAAVLGAVATTSASQAQVITNDRSPTTASFKLGASSDLGKTTQTSFAGGDTVVIAGAVMPQAADIGKSGDIFIVLRTTTATAEGWSFRNSSGTFIPWNTMVATLQPAYSVSSLAADKAFEIYNGRLIPAQHCIYIGYRVAGTTVLHFTGAAHNLTVK